MILYWSYDTTPRGNNFQIPRGNNSLPLKFFIKENFNHIQK